MIIGDRLRAIRISKHLSQDDIEQRSGLLRCYISRVENGHTVPAIETLKKMACALDMQLYQVFYEPELEPSYTPDLSARPQTAKWGDSGKNRRYLDRLTKRLSRLSDRNRGLIMNLLNEMNSRNAG